MGTASRPPPCNSTGQFSPRLLSGFGCWLPPSPEVARKHLRIFSHPLQGAWCRPSLVAFCCDRRTRLLPQSEVVGKPISLYSNKGNDTLGTDPLVTLIIAYPLMIVSKRLVAGSLQSLLCDPLGLQVNSQPSAGHRPGEKGQPQLEDADHIRLGEGVLIRTPCLPEQGRGGSFLRRGRESLSGFHHGSESRFRFLSRLRVFLAVLCRVLLSL